MNKFSTSIGERSVCPPLEMVDDIISAVKCGSTVSAINAKIYAFIEEEKSKNFKVTIC